LVSPELFLSLREVLRDILSITSLLALLPLSSTHHALLGCRVERACVGGCKMRHATYDGIRYPDPVVDELYKFSRFVVVRAQGCFLYSSKKWLRGPPVVSSGEGIGEWRQRNKRIEKRS
jgi:hypothetical protein